MRLIFLFILLSSSILVHAQHENLITENQIWRPGRIVLDNGSQLKGELNYNFITGVVAYRKGEFSKSYTSNSVSYFVIENDIGEEKRFYSLPFMQNGSEAYIFFEVIYEKGNLVLLSRHEFEYKERTNSAGAFSGPMGAGSTFTTQIEKVSEFLYFIDEQGQILEYAKALKDKSHKVTFNNFSRKDYLHNGYDDSKTELDMDLKYKITNDDVIPMMTRGYYNQIQRFIKKNKLKVNTVNELAQVMDYYAEIY